MELSTFALRIKMTNFSCRNKINIFEFICPNTRLCLIVIHSQHPLVNVRCTYTIRRKFVRSLLSWPRIGRLTSQFTFPANNFRRWWFFNISSYSLPFSAPFGASVSLRLLHCECQSGRHQWRHTERIFTSFVGRNTCNILADIDGWRALSEAQSKEWQGETGRIQWWVDNALIMPLMKIRLIMTSMNACLLNVCGTNKLSSHLIYRRMT